jgi:prevent-host-death family protein
MAGVKPHCRSRRVNKEAGYGFAYNLPCALFRPRLSMHSSGIVEADGPYHHLYGQEREMNAISLAKAKAHLSELIDRVEMGDSFDITRGGTPVARLTAVATPRKRVDAALLQSLTETMSPQPEDAAILVRAMRNGDRS